MYKPRDKGESLDRARQRGYQMLLRFLSDPWFEPPAEFFDVLDEPERGDFVTARAAFRVGISQAVEDSWERVDLRHQVDLLVGLANWFDPEMNICPDTPTSSVRGVACCSRWEGGWCEERKGRTGEPPSLSWLPY